jgi:hypothetical protein
MNEYFIINFMTVIYFKNRVVFSYNQTKGLL